MRGILALSLLANARRDDLPSALRAPWLNAFLRKAAEKQEKHGRHLWARIPLAATKDAMDAGASDPNPTTSALPPAACHAPTRTGITRRFRAQFHRAGMT